MRLGDEVTLRGVPATVTGLGHGYRNEMKIPVVLVRCGDQAHRLIGNEVLALDAED